MWEIRYVDKAGRDRIALVESADRAFRIAKDMAGKGKRPRVLRCRTDIFIADPETEQIFLLTRRVGIRDAALFALRYAKTERSAGCMLWPSGQQIPAGWRVVREE